MIKKFLKRFIYDSEAEKDSAKEGEENDGYVELDHGSQTFSKSKIAIRPFVIEDFESIKPILDTLRAGKTIALINIKPLKDKDLIELKRAVNKLKKTCDAIDGDIAGIGEDLIAATPSFAYIYRAKKKEKNEEITGFDE